MPEDEWTWFIAPVIEVKQQLADLEKNFLF